MSASTHLCEACGNSCHCGEVERDCVGCSDDCHYLLIYRQTHEEEPERERAQQTESDYVHARLFDDGTEVAFRNWLQSRRS